MNPVTKFMLVVLAVIVMVIASAMMNGPTELQAAQDVADDAAYAQALADGGAGKCAALGRNPVWTPEGHLICRLRLRQPVQALAVAQSSQP